MSDRQQTCSRGLTPMNVISLSAESVCGSNVHDFGTERLENNNGSLHDLGHEEFESSEEYYLKQLAEQHEEHERLLDAGFIGGSQFWPETADDKYNKNMYTMSCFYHGEYPFDSWEEEYDHYLYVEVSRVIDEENIAPCMYHRQ